MDTKLDYSGTKLNTSNFIFWCLKGFPADFELPEYDLILDDRKTHNGVIVDPYIPLTVIEQIISIPDIKVLEAAQGKSTLQPTYLIIQLETEEKITIEEFVKILQETETIKCNFEYDPQTKIHRIGITTDINVIENTEKFKTWWSFLPVIISNAVIKLLK